MAKFSVYSIGRSAEVDVQLSDSTVSRSHAELLITADGKYYLSDCNSSAGTYVVKGATKTAIKQAYVEQLDSLCFGDYQVTLQQLLSKIEQGSKLAKQLEPSAKDELPSGPVHRDPSSGEIIGDK
ncbi:MAG: hypothetical protein COC19_06515 [SAR86 cluster bacterium]|uniref:FHA domain-containing protein n=1 Tax=SAR86 cluster bacterium TaxID=2030880 RepID=A0A2A4MJC5_9GAMM|nr:MAG: hypothetical protein COC19_06515 [SAR86 cluster bacterium]